jgi:hypothetical protein
MPSATARLRPLRHTVPLLLALAVPAPALAGAGDLDPSFHDGGVLSYPVAADDAAMPALAVGTDGTIVAIYDRELHRITGTTDEVVTLPAPGVIATLLGPQVLALADGGWVIAGMVIVDRPVQRNCIVVQRLTAAMELDATFGGDGAVQGACVRQLEIWDAAVGSDGRIYVVGSIPNVAGKGGFLESYSPDGALRTFRDGLFFPDPEAAPYHVLTSIAVSPGRSDLLWVGGWLDRSWYGGEGWAWIAARIDRFGEYAPGFPELRLLEPPNADDVVTVAAAPGGGVFVGGSSGVPYQATIFQLRADGSNETGFGLLGFVRFRFDEQPSHHRLHELFLAPATGLLPAQLYVLGAASVDGAVRALHLSGAANTSFGPLGNGSVLLPSTIEPGATSVPRVRGGIAARGAHLVAGTHFRRDVLLEIPSLTESRIFRLLRF